MVGEGARVSVDPGRSIQIRGADQITVLGRLDAWGGRISIQEPRVGEQPYVPKANPRSVWIGEQAVLDTAGRSHVATDARGRRYGTVQAGGAIEIGGTLNWEADVDTRTRPIDRHVILRPGSLLDASGTQAVLDLPGRGATLVGSDGGSIVLASANSLHWTARCARRPVRRRRPAARWALRSAVPSTSATCRRNRRCCRSAGWC